ncbi:unnamed protein product, partial [Allacma fusca]
MKSRTLKRGRSKKRDDVIFCHNRPCLIVD